MGPFQVGVLVFRWTLGGARGVRSKNPLVNLKIRVLTLFSASLHTERPTELLGKSEAFKKVSFWSSQKELIS